MYVTLQDDLTSQAFSDPGLIKEAQSQDHRIRVRPTLSGWVSFIAWQGQRPTILLAPDRATLMAEAHRLIRYRIDDKR
jgi:hypothetical protein